MNNRKYWPLLTYLAALPADHQTVTLTLTEIETLIGPLAPSAYIKGYWASSVTARQNWKRQGFDARLDRLDRTVRFTRR